MKRPLKFQKLLKISLSDLVSQVSARSRANQPSSYDTAAKPDTPTVLYLTSCTISLRSRLWLSQKLAVSRSCVFFIQLDALKNVKFSNMGHAKKQQQEKTFSFFFVVGLTCPLFPVHFTAFPPKENKSRHFCASYECLFPDNFIVAETAVPCGGAILYTGDVFLKKKLQMPLFMQGSRSPTYVKIPHRAFIN